MTVQLDDDNRPVAWGKQIAGADIPDPPTANPPWEYRWDGSWVHDPPTVDPWARPGVVDETTRDIIAEKFRSKGADALSELDAIESNGNVPAEVTAYLQDVFAMQYLTYVSLTGDRIDAVEQRFFPDG